MAVVEVVDSRPQWSPNSHYFKETHKWDVTKSQGGMRPDSFQEFPRMLYMAKRKEDGAPLRCNDPLDERFSASCQLEVGNEIELERAERDGWRKSPGEAMAYVEEQGDIKALATAHRHFEDKRLSEKAQAEAKAVDESTAEQVPEITEQPRARRGRPPNPKA